MAATRARKRLHLVALLQVEHAGSGQVAVRRPSGSALLVKLWPALQADFERTTIAALASLASATAPASPDPMRYPLRRLALDWKPPALPPSLPWRPLQREEQARDTAVEFSWASETARHVGTVVHLFLHRMAEDGLDAWDGRRVDAMDAVVRLALKQQGVPSLELEPALARVRQALKSVLDDPRGRWILSREHRNARSEYRLTGAVDGGFVNVSLDRTFVDKDGVRWIVDYKIGAHGGAEPDSFLDREVDRYRTQLERYAALLARIESRPTRLGLYFPLLRGWREWQAPSAIV